MDHKTHPVVTLKEEYEVKTAQLRKIESEVQQMIHERKQKVKEIKDRVKLSEADADRQIADGVQVLTALMSCIQKWQDDFNQTVKEKLKSTEKQAEGLIKELEQEIKDLTNRSSEVKELTHTEDHLHFLQTFRSLKNPSHTRDWTTVEVCPPSYVGTMRRTLDQLQETLNMEMKKVPDLRSTLLECECLFSLIHHNTHSLFRWTVHPHSSRGRPLIQILLGMKMMMTSCSLLILIISKSVYLLSYYYGNYNLYLY